MGADRLVRQAEARRNERKGIVPLPWMRIPFDIPALSGIILTIDAMPPAESDPEIRFWSSLRAHCEAIAMRIDRGQAPVG